MVTIPTHDTKGRLRPLWRILSAGKSYLIPETVDEFRQLGYFPFLTINGQSIFLTDEGRAAFANFVDLLWQHYRPANVSYDLVKDSSRKILEQFFASGGNSDFKWYLETVTQSIVKL